MVPGGHNALAQDQADTTTGADAGHQRREGAVKNARDEGGAQLNRSLKRPGMQKSISPAKLLLTVDEVNNALGCSRASIYRWLSDGAFPVPVKVGTRPRFYATDIDKWLKESRGLPPEPEQLRRARAKSDVQAAA